MKGYGFNGVSKIRVSEIWPPDPYRPRGEDYLFEFAFKKDDETGKPAKIEFHLDTETTMELTSMLQRLLRPGGERKLELVVVNSD